MHKAAIGIIGASGYAGIEATRILSAHAHVELKLLTSDRWAGETVAAKLGLMGATGALKYAPLDRSLELARGCDAVLLATPAEYSLEAAPKLVAAGVRVIDLSGAFRLRDTAAYERFYNFTHHAPELLALAPYGLPELFREGLRDAKLISNPGCFATAAALALAPLLRAHLLDDSSLIFDAASGTTGAGRKGTEDMSFSEVNEDFRAYRVLRHQHTPEIAQTLARCARRTVPLTFTPHLLPVKRGILVTAYARLRAGVTPAEAKEAMVNTYAGAPFVGLLGSPDEVNLKRVVGTNRCELALGVDATGFDPGRVVVTAAIDNLVKGAAGQAVQNLNLAMGWEETAGLDTLRAFYP
ncbi:N-acetyl-gamma-glutamyl-phosphate reductase [Myxococcaceae bacterium GXIMD 01537]